MDACHFGKMHIFTEAKETIFASRSYFVLYTLVGHKLPIIVCIHLEDLLEMPDVIPIRCQNQPDYLMEGSEGEACRKRISFSDN